MLPKFNSCFATPGTYKCGYYIEMTTSRLNVDSIDSDRNGMKNGGEHLGETGTDLELESWCSQDVVINAQCAQLESVIP